MPYSAAARAIADIELSSSSHSTPRHRDASSVTEALARDRQRVSLSEREEIIQRLQEDDDGEEDEVEDDDEEIEGDNGEDGDDEEDANSNPTGQAVASIFRAHIVDETRAKYQRSQIRLLSWIFLQAKEQTRESERGRFKQMLHVEVFDTLDNESVIVYISFQSVNTKIQTHFCAIFIPYLLRSLC